MRTEASCGSQESEMAEETSIWKREIRLASLRAPRDELRNNVHGALA